MTKITSADQAVGFQVIDLGFEARKSEGHKASGGIQLKGSVGGEGEVGWCAREPDGDGVCPFTCGRCERSGTLESKPWNSWNGESENESNAVQG